MCVYCLVTFTQQCKDGLIVLFHHSYSKTFPRDVAKLHVMYVYNQLFHVSKEIWK